MNRPTLAAIIVATIASATGCLKEPSELKNGFAVGLPSGSTTQRRGSELPGPEELCDDYSTNGDFKVYHFNGYGDINVAEDAEQTMLDALDKEWKRHRGLTKHQVRALMNYVSRKNSDDNALTLDDLRRCGLNDTTSDAYRRWRQEARTLLREDVSAPRYGLRERTERERRRITHREHSKYTGTI